jgi:hypothetical protein
MKVLLLFLLLCSSTAIALNQTAGCPYDGESANFTGQRNGSGAQAMCHYAHDHMHRPDAQDQTYHYVHHEFWANCGD